MATDTVKTEFSLRTDLDQLDALWAALFLAAQNQDGDEKMRTYALIDNLTHQVHDQAMEARRGV